MKNVNLVLIYNSQEFVDMSSFLAEKFSVNLIFINEKLISIFQHFNQFVNDNSCDGIILDSQLKNLKQILEFSDNSYLDVLKINSCENLNTNLNFEKYFNQFITDIQEDLKLFNSFEKISLSN